MEDGIKQIGQRLIGLRESLDLSTQELADTCGITVEKYEKIERGEADITISNLMKIARKYGVSADALMFGEEPHMRSYSVVRSGKGVSVERTKAYKYESLTAGMHNARIKAFIVTVEPKPSTAKAYKNTHDGQEFNLVLEGSMELYYDQKVITLEAGDSICFDSTHPHGMLAKGDKPVKFIAVVTE